MNITRVGRRIDGNGSFGSNKNAALPDSNLNNDGSNIEGDEKPYFVSSSSGPGYRRGSSSGSGAGAGAGVTGNGVGAGVTNPAASSSTGTGEDRFGKIIGGFDVPHGTFPWQV